MRIPNVFVLAVCVLGSMAFAEEQPASSGSRVERINGVPTLVVDGAPFLVLGAQCDIWRSTKQDKKTIAFFDGYRAMNATTVSVGVPWSKIEVAQDKYDFTFLDWFIEQAQSRGLKLVVNLFNANVCGKVGESGPNATYDPQYAPGYILNTPEKYQRMILPAEYTYAWGGPPLCPNDPGTLDRERRYVVRVAEHLRDRDTRRTVIMLQIDNEFYYQQWEGQRPKEEQRIRCRCPYCEAKYDPAKYETEERFMFKSLADYANAVSTAIRQVYAIPLYLNSPWWPPYVVAIFLAQCPNIDFVGIDGIFDPREPNMLSSSQVDRNIPFAAENPTEQPKTRFNLDVLPYYTVAGRQGIGNLLWECGPPRTVVEDPAACRCYGNALKPIRDAMAVIAQTRGTDRFAGWYALRDFAAETIEDAFGNFATAKDGTAVVRSAGFVVREGRKTRQVEEDHFDLRAGAMTFTISNTVAGMLIQIEELGFVVATSGARLSFGGGPDMRAESGVFAGDKWRPVKEETVKREGGRAVIELEESCVLRLIP